MPLVFIHGVANRKTDDYEDRVVIRNAFLRSTVLKHFLNNENATIYNPMWGELVPELPKNNPIIPSINPGDENYEAFGSVSESSYGKLQSVYIGAESLGENRLLPLARQSFTDFADQLWQEVVMSPEVIGDEDLLAEAIEVGLVLAAYAAENPEPDWVNDAANDDEFLDQLEKEVEKWRQAHKGEGAEVAPHFQGFGAIDWLRSAGEKIKQKVVDVPNNLLLRAMRPGLTRGLVDFFGDVFYYQSYRGDKGNAGKIPSLVLADLHAARQEASDTNEKLIVVAHSMGGNIAYDLFSHFDPALKVDEFITVGCQASLFKQLTLFKQQELGILPVQIGEKASKPSNVGRWINVFDPQDILSFAFQPEFDGVADYYFESPGGVTSAHGDYFNRIRFYERLVARLQKQ